ncbi:MAG: translocation/assembly module TamB [Bacteroidetes bacterium]|nr:translocation/assembly module TamB [Bacteroidota bacterium]
MLFSFILIVVFLGVLVWALQTESFQTWTAQKLTAYLSKEVNAKIEIDRVKISFISNVTLQGVFVSDKHNDTLVYGKNITVDVSGFNYKTHRLNLDAVNLSDVKVKLLKYKNEEDWNFQYLADYFASKDTTKTDTMPSPWKITYGELKLNNVDFTYHLLRDTDKVIQNMNYNNIHVSHVFGSLTDIDFKGDTIFAQINHLSAKEQCGIAIKNLTTKAKVSPAELRCDSLTLRTDNSYVKGKLKFKYDRWLDYQDFINKVYIKGNLKDSTYVNFKDIAYFAEELNGFNEVLVIKGKVRGYVNDLSGTDMMVSYRSHTQFIGDMGITGLPDIDKSYIHFDAQKLSTSKSDLEKFPIPPFSKPTYLKLPNEVEKLGVISYKGKFDGFINNFATYGTFKTDVGNLKTDLQLDNTSKSKIVQYSGSISSTSFDLSKLFPDVKFVGPISLSTKIKGKGLTKKEMDATFDGVVQSVVYNHYQYKNVKIDGAFKNQIFEGNVVSKDTNANFDFNGTIDFIDEVPKMDFISTINNFDLDKTNFSTSQLNGRVSSQILIKLNGDNIDNLSGQINFDNTIYQTDEKLYKLSSFNLDLDQSTSLKNIKLTSNIANVQLSGKYKLSTLPDAFLQYLNEYFPTFVKTKTRHIYSDKADLKVKIKNFTIVKELFLKDLMISPNSLVESSFDASINYLNLKTNSDLINYSGIKFKNNKIGVNSLPNGVSFSYDANAINVSDSFAFKNPSLVFIANDKTTNFNLNWDNQSTPNNAGVVDGKIVFGNTTATVLFDKIKYVIEDSTWQIVKSNPIVIDTSFSVAINSLTFYNQNQLVTIDGKLSKNNADKLDIFIQNFKLAQLNPFIEDSKMTIDGTLTGNTTVFGVFGKTIVSSQINFQDLKLNNKLIGYGEINSEYNPEKEYVNINGFSAFAKDFDGNLLKNIEFQGYYFPKKKEESIDITFKAEPLDLSLLQPFLDGILNFKVGFLNGNGKITGTLDNPQINARLKFFKCVMVVDFLNVQYSVNGNVDVMPKQINFENIEIRDKMGNSGSVYGNIFHNNFKDMRIDFDINTNKLMVLNTTAANNPSYYGTAYASGNAGIYGFLDDIKMELNMKTNGGTYFYIPLDGPAEIGNNDFIRFVTKDTVKTIVKTNKSNFSLDFNLEATKDAEVQLIFDEKSGDIIKARGDGILNMKINSKGKFDMFGDYVLSTGDYLFTLEDFVTKKFEIQKGSSIKWNGNVYKANIDIVANYKQRASIKPLFPNDSTNNYNKRFPVDCKLYMKDKLTSPDITFGIELPTIDETTRSAIKSILSDENELNRQVFSLLLLRSFVTPVSVAGAGGISAGGAAAATGSEMLSNKMSNWLNGVTKDIDIGVNYRPGGSLSSDELDLALSKQLFNNRLSIDGNFGVANNNTTSNTTTTKSNNSSNLIGDVTLEYKLSESGKYRVKVFNRSNDNTEAATSGGPFTQGLGIFYREEYENLGELYRRYIAKLKRKNKAKENNK